MTDAADDLEAMLLENARMISGKMRGAQTPANMRALAASLESIARAVGHLKGVDGDQISALIAQLLSDEPTGPRPTGQDHDETAEESQEE